MMVRPFLYAAFAMEFVALTGVVLLVRPAGEPNRGPLYLLTLTTLAMMAVLLAGWVIESEGVTEATPELALQAMVLLAIGFGVYLAVPPFHFWLSSSATESDPYVLTFVSLAVQSAGIFFLFRFLDTYAWLRQETLVFALLRYTGGITTLLGAIWALSQRSMRRVLAFASISDIGAILLAIGIATPDGFRLALGLMLSRVVGLALASLGLAMLTTSESTDDAQGLAGAIQSHPLATSGIVAGLLTLAGYPLTAGFPGRWGILLNLSQLDVAPSIAVLFAFIALLGTAVRWLFIFLTPSGQESQERLRSWEAFFALGGVALAAILGIFPQLIYPWILQAVEGMSQLFP
jgi:formate hydrogenlyase subunit 3/multisubunit Na+/H+ antiporter MnhD subunit